MYEIFNRFLFFRSFVIKWRFSSILRLCKIMNTLDDVQSEGTDCMKKFNFSEVYDLSGVEITDIFGHW